MSKRYRFEESVSEVVGLITVTSFNRRRRRTDQAQLADYVQRQ